MVNLTKLGSEREALRKILRFLDNMNADLKWKASHTSDEDKSKDLMRQADVAGRYWNKAVKEYKRKKR